MQREIAHNLATGERRTNDVAPGKVKTFSELNLRHEIVLGLQSKNFLTPTMIQAAAIPIALTRKDMLVQSKSGTGKTLIYAIAILQGFKAGIKTPQALVIVPTRELAVQVKETISCLGEFLPTLKVSYFIGGIDVITDRRRIKNCDVVIGTPGRLLHLYRNNVLCLNNMNLLVLDEADQLYQLNGLYRSVIELIRKLPQQMQKIACSATYERNLDEQLAKSMNKPVLISNSERATVLLGIRQFVYELPRQINNIEQMNCKVEAVIKIFNLVPYEQVVLFASSKMRADSFRNYLARRGVKCHLISGAMNQEERSEVFDCYRYFKMRTLVATDVFARGVDSPHTNLIVNLDPPRDHVDYLHRIGRAGRFGSKGIAITLVYEDAESDHFKGILSKAHTGKSVLQFPNDAEKGLDFWNFTTYAFPYYIKEEEIQQLQEFPKKVGAPKTSAGPTKEAAGYASMKKDALMEEKTSADGNSSKKWMLPSRRNLHQLQDPMNAHIKEDKVNILAKEAQAAPEGVSSRTECAEEEKGTNIKDPSTKDKPASCAPNQDKPEISVVACHKLEETIKDALMEDRLVGSCEEENTEIPQKLDENDAQKINSILVENVIKSNNYCVGKDKPDKASGKDSLKEQPPPTIKVTKLEMENDTEKNKENLPNNNNTQKPDEFISPELTPSSLTPLDLTQDHTLTPPAPPVNSINNKTYCLAAPTATSSLTLQAMVISNTVDDASSISSDCSMGSRSESLSSLYSNTDVKQIWKKYLIIQKRRQRSAKIQSPKLMYNWSTSNHVNRVKRKRKVKIQTLNQANKGSISKPVSRMCKDKPMKIDEQTVSLFAELKYCRLIEKLDHSETIVKRLLRYSIKRKMSNVDVNIFVKLLYDAYNEIYGLKSIWEPKKSKGNEAQNKLTVRVAHRMNIPPVPAADDDPATGSEANEASQQSEEFTDNEDDYEEDMEEEDEGNSSSGFVESNESASSGIDTSEYNTDSSTEGDQDYDEYDDDDETGASSMYGSELSEEDLEWEEAEDEEESEAESTGSNVSLFGTSYKGSDTPEDEDLQSEEREELETEDVQSNMEQETLDMYQQMFQTQYQFILAHVASQMAEP
ncbi:LOW QUALITY PROTEIN: ATP-dependent RNA helicase DBP4 [Drosophila serrata]|uniref:LOW QUALITY PROTEIN: ATP-dependent RNA helicase DBP4 n=1 Tax=Drosophila serrata TaxID=7274 RepID=UPI000A1D2CED|nr:LOW QUALITY PROTEIN: ATP-dependent RNA helicase DBP4 [Drosophila serrata]